MPEWIVDRLLEFAEENWDAFLQRCAEAGVSEKEVEQEFDQYKANR